MNNMPTVGDRFKAPEPRQQKLYKCFCSNCDIDFRSANKHRKLCLHCAGPGATREVPE